MDPSPDDQDTPRDAAPSTANVAIAVAVVLVLLVLVAVLADASYTSDEDDVVADVTTSTATTIPPAAPDSTAPSVAPGSDSPLVGMTEIEVRELYPVVRVVEVDGEPLMVTADLVPGRIDLALRDDVVVAATVEGCEELPADAPSWLLQSCDPDPTTDGPSATGKLLAGPSGDDLVLEVGTQGDQYHQGMAVAPEDTAVVRTSSGVPLAADELVVGDVVWLWTEECAESSPVQCRISAVVVDRPAEDAGG